MSKYYNVTTMHAIIIINNASTCVSCNAVAALVSVALMTQLQAMMTLAA